MWRRPVGRSPVRIIFSVFIAIKFVATKLQKIALTAKYAAFAFEKRGKCGRNIARKACFLRKKLCGIKKMPIFAPLLQRERAFSSAGSEHLPYKQRVGGSNPSTPTLNIGVSLWILLFLYFCCSVKPFWYYSRIAPIARIFLLVLSALAPRRWRIWRILWALHAHFAIGP